MKWFLDTHTLNWFRVGGLASILGGKREERGLVVRPGASGRGNG